MIYVVQRNNSQVDYEVIYAGSSAHEALIAASKYTSCRINTFKNGKKFEVVANGDEVKKQPSKGLE